MWPFKKDPVKRVIEGYFPEFKKAIRKSVADTLSDGAKSQELSIESIVTAIELLGQLPCEQDSQKPQRPTQLTLKERALEVASYNQRYGQEVAYVTAKLAPKDYVDFLLDHNVPAENFRKGYELARWYGKESVAALIALARDTSEDLAQLVDAVHTKGKGKVNIQELGDALNHISADVALHLKYITIPQRVEIERGAEEQSDREPEQRGYKIDIKIQDGSQAYELRDLAWEVARDLGIHRLAFDRDQRIVVVEALPIRLEVYQEVLKRTLKSAKIKQVNLPKKFSLAEI